MKTWLKKALEWLIVYLPLIKKLIKLLGLESEVNKYMAFIGVDIDKEKLQAMLDELKDFGVDNAKAVIEIIRKYPDDIFVFKGIAGMVVETLDGKLFNSLLDLLLEELDKI